MKSFSLMLPASVAAVPHIPGSARARLVELQTHSLHFQAPGEGHWTETGFYIVAPLLVLAVLFLIVKCVKGPPPPATLMEVAEAQAELERQSKEIDAAEKEIKDAEKRTKGEDLEAEVEEDDTEAPDYEGALRAAAQMIAQTVGPKVAKGQAVKTILETRVDTLQKQTKAFVIDEVNGTAGAVLNELGAEEAMLLLDPKKALDGNFPPAAVLLAGLMSPIIMGLTAANHIAQALIHFLPIICLCIAAVIIDEGSVCFIPYMREWVWAHLIMGTILFLAHICQVIKVLLARSALQQDVADRTADIKRLTKNKNPTVQDVRDVFISICVIVQKALQSEDGVRRSFFNLIVGLGTMIWIVMTIWTFIIVIGYTFVPGVIAFHESAKETAGDEYCGTWMSVLAARLCCLIGVVFLMINMMIVSQWFADGLRYQPGYVEQVLAQAKKADDQAGGVPVVQTLVKAFVLRGSSDTLEVQAACAAQDKYRLQTELKAVEKELASCTSQLQGVESTLEGFEKEVALLPPRGFVQIKKPEPTPAVASGPGVMEQANEAMDDAIKRGNEAVAEAEVAMKAASEKAQKEAEKVKKQAEEALAQAKEQGEEAYAKAKEEADKAMAIAEEEAKKLKEQFDSIDWDAQRKKAEEYKAAAIAGAKELQEQTKKKLQEMLELIMKKLEELRNSDAVKQAIEEAQKRAEEAQAKLKEIADSEEVQAALQGDTSKLQEKGKQLAQEGVEKGKQIAQDVKEKVENVDLEEVKGQVKEAAAKGAETAKGAAEQAKAEAEKVVKKK